MSRSVKYTYSKPSHASFNLLSALPSRIVALLLSQFVSFGSFLTLSRGFARLYSGVSGHRRRASASRLLDQESSSVVYGSRDPFSIPAHHFTDSKVSASSRRLLSYIADAIDDLLAGFLVLAAVTGVQARCPHRRSGLLSTCDYTVCSPAECAAQGLECCPKPCGGSWCVKGIRPPPEFTEICPPVFNSAQDCIEPRNNTTCEQLNCFKVGSICCRNGCKENYCYLVPSTFK
ncbi:uncharacterized protein LOC142582032 [Dermacentor variabilis]|uniref:uncharacterized protein LOC142582032 n=1 Tax=Dermacentor variabilis TaxID=34621 RepID=UPI003F5B8655